MPDLDTEFVASLWARALDAELRVKKQRNRRKAAEARAAELEDINRRLTPRARYDEFNKLRDQRDTAVKELEDFRKRIVSALGVTPHPEQTIDWLVCAVMAANDVADEATVLRDRVAKLADELETAYSGFRAAIARSDEDRSKLAAYARQIRAVLDAKVEDPDACPS